MRTARNDDNKNNTKKVDDDGEKFFSHTKNNLNKSRNTIAITL